MRTYAFCCLHYGAPYLAWSIRSVIDAVDRFVVIYTPQGSHGSRSTLPNPDTHDELLQIAHEAAGNKLIWREGIYTHEGQHRDAVFEIAPEADVILTVDSDEIWMPAQLELLLKSATTGNVRSYLAYEMPFWRSFQRAIPERLCAPARAVRTRNGGGTLSTDAWFGHFGYAQPTRYIEYKMSLHGHKADWRPNWFADKWLPNAQTDLHPTNYDFWNARRVLPNNFLPTFMQEHPFAHLEVIV